jgi:uncharacterized protein YaiI (UPF0178 family)
MSIWVDADACPKVIKEILFRAAERTSIQVTLVVFRPSKSPMDLMWLILKSCEDWSPVTW